jgi:class 3 adenylate cyclase/tetratricopeptide (TPR) repeat protein
MWATKGGGLVMSFDELLAEVLSLLEREKRVSYRALKLRFKLDDDYIETLKDEIINAKRQGIDEDGKVLVWIGGSRITPARAADSQVVELPSSGDVPEQTPSADPLAFEPERRQLTVMFSDLVDSTSLSGRLDPEDLREVVRAYQETCAEIIQHFDGYIAQYLGDSLLIYYGYPHAHEDDAHRAIRTGLDIVEALGRLNTRLARTYDVRLSVRIGIHTGLAVVGEIGAGGRHERLAVGKTPNIADRLQRLAAPNTVVISALTYQLTRGYFVCQDLGTHSLRGVAAPLQVYRILRESETQSRLEVALLTGLTPLVGREETVKLLGQCWEQSKAGPGQVVLLSGEGGIGKSRLVEALRERVRREGCWQITFGCSPYHTHSAFYAVTDRLQRLLQWHRDDSLAEKLEKLERWLQGSRFPLQESVVLFGTLLSLPLPEERYPPLGLSPQGYKRKVQEALVARLLEEAERQPVLTVWEDLHWADPSTLETLDLLIDQAATVRLLILLVFRSEFHPTWISREHLTQIPLDRLGPHQVEQMVVSLTKGKPLPPEVLQQVLAKTDGVPLFVEELVKMIVESGLVQEEADRYVLTEPLPPLAIPATLRDSLMARLDHLETARGVAQLGATLGREFSYEAMQAVSPMDELTLQRGLSQLVKAELLYQHGLPPQARYTFKHALIQDAAYQSLLKSTRQRYHQRIAGVLAERFPDLVATQPELLAHHYTEAGLRELAIPYWQQAGQQALERSANIEAIRHLTRGLDLLNTLPETSARVQQELTLQLTLGSALYVTRGRDLLEVEAAYTRAYELCQQTGETSQRFAVLTALWRLYFSQARLPIAHAWAKQGFEFAQDMQDRVLLQEAYQVMGSTLLLLGEPTAAYEHFERGLAYSDPHYSRTLAVIRGTDPGVERLARMSWTLWLLGYPDQALRKSYEALTLARESPHAYSLGLALCHVAVLHVWRLEAPAALEQSDVLVRLASEQGFVLWLGGGMCTRGWALVEQGEVEAGLSQLRQGLQSRGENVGLTHNLAMLAEAYGKTNQAAAGLRVLSEAQTMVRNSAERHYEAELYRLKGELLLTQQSRRHSPAEAQENFFKALTLARDQHAKSLELRTVMSLSRLWQHQDKRDAAHELLADTYGWFSEGFDTPDLQMAQALLRDLA